MGDVVSLLEAGPATVVNHVSNRGRVERLEAGQPLPPGTTRSHGVPPFVPRR
jgi:hypothetical protein